jgi:hypothetical protein
VNLAVPSTEPARFRLLRNKAAFYLNVHKSWLCAGIMRQPPLFLKSAHSQPAIHLQDRHTAYPKTCPFDQLSKAVKMHERDLRRQALESGKTVSRKQKAKHLSARSSQAGSTGNSPAVSPSQSPAHSRSGSRAPSRHGSEDEDEESDELASR